MQRTTIEQARADWQSIFPDQEERRLAATIMAETVVRAHAIHPEGWMVSYKPHKPYLNINIGPIFAFSVSPGRVALLLDAGKLAPDSLPGHWGGAKYGTRWKVLPETTWTEGPAAEVLARWDQLKGSYFSAVDMAARKRATPPWWRHHDANALLLLREETGRELPDPALPGEHSLASDSLETLIEEFAAVYPPSSEGQKHIKDNLTSADAFRLSFEAIRQARVAGQDVTAAVLTKLLPHTDTANNLERGAWITPAPVFKTDVRKFLEAGGKATPEDWPRVASLIMDLFETCHADPGRLAEACATFVRDLPIRGLQAAGLSPGLAVLNPDAFVVVNAKPLAAVQRFLGRKHTAKMAEYPAACADVLELVEKAREGLQAIPELDRLPLTWRFDMFTHWLVAGRPPEEVRYWKIAPGEQAFNWNTCREGGFISMGWEKFGDLSDMSREEFDVMARELANQDAEYSPGGTPQLWQFAHEIRTGDRIIANKGLSRILGVGTVDGEYYFEPDVVHGHRLPVRWDDFTPVDVAKQGWMKTIVSLKKQQFESLIGVAPPPPPPPPPPAGQNVWMFQANPKLFNLEHQLQVEGLEAIDAWKVAVFKDKMQPGDIALLWQAGKRAGIYAIAELTGPVFEVTVETADEFVEAGGHKVPMRITQILDVPVTKARLLEEKSLANLHILKAPFGTNFKVTAEEWAVIEPLTHPVGPREKLTLKQVAAETGFEIPDLQRWLNAINRKGQAVLYGPPGTGKTFVADRLARLLAGGNDSFVDLVQFHPAYAYEDFIQGLRPVLTPKGGLDYRLVPGRFLEFCRKAERRQGTCVLILDEINRANLARVFGELMYLLEYRDQTVPLASGGELRIPKNVRIIGTMNTADRSIALVDHALRRRFAFIHLRPQYAVLEKYHQGNGYDPAKLVKTLRTLNQHINDPHYEVGISFFLKQDLNAHLEDIWRMEIEPYLEEYFFDQPAKAKQFSWEELKKDLG